MFNTSFTPHTIGPTDVIQPSPIPHFKTSQLFLTYFPEFPSFDTQLFIGADYAVGTTAKKLRGWEEMPFHSSIVSSHGGVYVTYGGEEMPLCYCSGRDLGGIT